MTKKELKIPDFDICKKYIPEAEKIDTMPEEETDIISLEFEEEALNELQQIADAWGVSLERTLQTMLIALVRENEV